MYIDKEENNSGILRYFRIACLGRSVTRDFLYIDKEGKM
jgi:hypothetical protein